MAAFSFKWTSPWQQTTNFHPTILRFGARHSHGTIGGKLAHHEMPSGFRRERLPVTRMRKWGCDLRWRNNKMGFVTQPHVSSPFLSSCLSLSPSKEARRWSCNDNQAFIHLVAMDSTCHLSIIKSSLKYRPFIRPSTSCHGASLWGELDEKLQTRFHLYTLKCDIAVIPPCISTVYAP